MNTYKTSDIAKMFGIHVNTVRLYETCGLIPKPVRQSNGYRVFTDIHVEQFKLARAALKVEVLQNGLRKQAVNIIKISAAGDYEKAADQVKRYAAQIEEEMEHAEEALKITRRILSGEDNHREKQPREFTRKEAADLLHVTIDTLRNWELNGLFTAKRQKNGYRIYTEDDMQRLKIIRSLRCANYSLASILRMLKAVSADPDTNIREIINTPGEDDDIVTACDKLLTSLADAKENAQFASGQIEKMKQLAKKPTFNHHTSQP
ncbi:MerR family transcriptional regulator [Clostridium sp. MCC353]|uniref:MerR family transcriptional regulator n=1 Tax=Clostridium sp. MCC353 TaxID=2592646 RepID=UPI001C025597|nr:MerR family transcriptional regulator [Clostridium sp. MCC353]MBT9775415.1 MerR family transcriptional regulator [Clostridium sp. MCC353]